MHWSIKFRCIAVIVTALLMSAHSAPGKAQDVLAACSTDIRQYCRNVTLGDGRLLACMYAHEDKVSDPCDAAISEAADQLDWFLDRLRSAVEQCAPDIAKHCASVASGEGRIYRCLQKNRSGITPGCESAVDQVTARLTE